MSRTSFLNLIEDMKDNLTSDQYMKLLNETQKLKDEDSSSLHVQVLYPKCIPIGDDLGIELKLDFDNFGFCVYKSKVSSNTWNAWYSLRNQKKVLKCINFLTEYFPEDANCFYTDWFDNPSYNCKHVSYVCEHEDYDVTSSKDGSPMNYFILKTYPAVQAVLVSVDVIGDSCIERIM